MVSYRGREVEITLGNVLHAPHLDHNLISIGCLDLKGCTITFGGGTAMFYELSGAPFMCGTCYNQTMYQVEFMPEATATMERDDTITTATMERDDTKTAISTGLSTKLASAENITETKANERVAHDLLGLARIQTPATDLSESDTNHLRADKRKDTMIEAVEPAHVVPRHQLRRRLRQTCTDRGGKVANTIWHSCSTTLGTTHKMTATHPPPTDKTPEQPHHTVADCMTVEAGSPPMHLGDVVATVIYFLNFIPDTLGMAYMGTKIDQSGRFRKVGDEIATVNAYDDSTTGLSITTTGTTLTKKGPLNSTHMLLQDGYTKTIAKKGPEGRLNCTHTLSQDGYTKTILEYCMHARTHVAPYHHPDRRRRQLMGQRAHQATTKDQVTMCHAWYKTLFEE
ncbi:hypothetical protein C0991_004881 [Blastosporella zonata]|nr:hypothetical protein C0991_004881 [Blastosporella zonata]